MPLKSGLSLVMLAYNEEVNLRYLLPEVRENIEKCGCEYEIIVVDTAKPTDNTEDVCIENGARYVRQREPYFGGAFRTAISEARYDRFLIMDSDGSHPPGYIPGIYRRFVDGDMDIVVGSRYIEGGITKDTPSSQRMSRLLNMVFRLVIGTRLRDISTDYRMYRTEDLRRCRLRCNYYDILEEVLLQIKLQKPRHRLRAAEVPIVFESRRYGISKRNLIRFIIHYGMTCFYLLGLRLLYIGRRL